MSRIPAVRCGVPVPATSRPGRIPFHARPAAWPPSRLVATGERRQHRAPSHSAAADRRTGAHDLRREDRPHSNSRRPSERVLARHQGMWGPADLKPFVDHVVSDFPNPGPLRSSAPSEPPTFPFPRDAHTTAAADCRHPFARRPGTVGTGRRRPGSSHSAISRRFTLAFHTFGGLSLTIRTLNLSLGYTPLLLKRHR